MSRVHKIKARSVALAFTLAVAGSAAAAPDPAAAWLGRRAPAFRLTDVVSGQGVALEDFRGRFIVLHFGASW